MNVTTTDPESPISPRPLLSPVSDSSSVDGERKTGAEILQEAFGEKLFPFNKWPGDSTKRAALKRVTANHRNRPQGLPPAESLEYCGIKRNTETKSLFFVADNYKWLLEGRIIPVSIARRWILSVCPGKGGSHEKKAAGEELSKSNPSGEFSGVELHYIQTEAFPSGRFTEKTLKEFSKSITESIEQWLRSRPIPDCHIRLFHGTSTESMNNILKKGIVDSRFQNVGDFGPGFYCSDKVRTSIRCSILSCFESTTYGQAPMSASMMYFDIAKDDLDDLNSKYPEGEEWSKWTHLCLKGLAEEVFAGEDNKIQLVVGRLVHNADEAGEPGKTPKAFEDSRLQYCFRKENGNLLLKNKKKMGGAVFLLEPFPGDGANEAASTP